MTTRGTRTRADETADESASLEAFLLPPSQRHRRDVSASGKVFYVGPALPSQSGIEDAEVGDSGEELGLCLELDVRLAAPVNEEPSKLTVKFR